MKFPLFMKRTTHARYLAAVAMLLVAPVLVFGDIENDLNTLFDRLTESISGTGLVVAIFPLVEKSTGGGERGKTVSEYAVTYFTAHPSFTVVEREQFALLAKEMALSQSGIIDSATAINTGAMVAARYLFGGTVTRGMGKQVISVRMIETETGRVVSAATMTVDSKHLDTFSREMLGERGQVSAMVLRSVIPGWGQLYAQKPARGAISLAAVVGMGAVSLVNTSRIAGKYSAWSNYESFLASPAQTASYMRSQNALGRSDQEVLNEFEQTRLAYYNDYASQFDKAKVLWILTGSVWALNLVDAAIAGVQSKKKFDLYFSGLPGASFSVLARLEY